MIYKQFTLKDIITLSANNIATISISNNSPCASDIAFFTGIRKLGSLNFFDINSPPAFGLTLQREMKYLWNFNGNILNGTTGNIVNGMFLSTTGEQSFKSSSNNFSLLSHQQIFNYVQGFLYRADNNYLATSALNSSSTAKVIDVIRNISLRKSLKSDCIQENSLRLEMNSGGTSTTGVVTATLTSLTTALDLKNPYGGNIGTAIKSFVGVPYLHGTSINSCSSSLTVESILRPYNNNSIILWRRLSSSGFSGAVTATENSFIKMELTKSADNNRNAFRFYIRSGSAVGDYSETFAKNDVQASGLFIPEEVGINLFDGRFHHLMVTWSISGIDGSLNADNGAGIVMGYIDGYKLLNQEQIEPRLPGADMANGPVIQANMYEQRIPIKTTPIQYNDPLDGSSSGNNLYIGISNFNRLPTDSTGDKGTLAASADANLYGGYDGQIQHLRMWSLRFNDGSTSLKHNINTKVTAASSAGLSFANFHTAVLTAANTNLAAWWNFNERSTLSATDSAANSNSASLVGNASINLYDHIDISRPTNPITESSLSSANITALYLDAPEKNVIFNDLNQGRIIRFGADGAINRMGMTFYDYGNIVFDKDDADMNLYFLDPTSGTTGNFGFSVTGLGNNAINIERIVFNSVNSVGRMVIRATAAGEEYNFTENITNINPETGEPLTNIPTTYITTIGFHNDIGDLLAIGKLSVPVRKDDAALVEVLTKLDF